MPVKVKNSSVQIAHCVPVPGLILRVEVENFFTKVKENVHETLSPASVDKSVHKINLPAKYCAFIYPRHVFA
jgi:hypothetical protein